MTRVTQGLGCQEPEVNVETQDHGVKMGAQGWQVTAGQWACLGTEESVGTRETSGPWGPKETRVIPLWWRVLLGREAAKGSRETVA